MNQNKEENKDYVLNNLDSYIIDSRKNFVHIDPDMMEDEHFYIAQGGLTSQGHKEIIEKFVEKIIAEKENWALNTNNDYWHRPSGKIMSRLGFTSQQSEKLRKELRSVQEIINNTANNNNGDNNIEELMREVEEAIRSQQRMFELIEQFGQRCKESDERLAKELEETKKRMKEENEKFNKEMDEMFEKARKEMNEAHENVLSGINQKKTTYRDNPITCEQCFFKVETDDPRTCLIDKKTGKKFCSNSCFSKFIENEVEKEQWEERMKQMVKEAQQIRESNTKKPEEQTTNTNQLGEKPSSIKPTSSEERRKKWEEERKQKREKFEAQMKDLENKNLEDSKEWAINAIETYYLIGKYLTEQETEKALGSNWKNEINDCSSHNKIMNKYYLLTNKLEKEYDKKKKLDNELWDNKNKAINDIIHYEKNGVSLYSSSVKEKLPSHLKNDRWMDYLRESNSLAELKSRQSKIESMINKEAKNEKNHANYDYRNYDPKNSGTGIAGIIIGLLIVGAVIGLVIYLVNKNKSQT